MTDKDSEFLASLTLGDESPDAKPIATPQGVFESISLGISSPVGESASAGGGV